MRKNERIWEDQMVKHQVDNHKLAIAAAHRSQDDNNKTSLQPLRMVFVVSSLLLTINNNYHDHLI